MAPQGQQDMVGRLNNNARRIRQLEETSRNLQEQVKNIEDEINQQKNKISTNEDRIQEGLEQLEEKVDNLSAEVHSLQRETRKLVTRREFNELQEYMDLMDPVTSSFVTKSEVEDIVEEKLTARRGEP